MHVENSETYPSIKVRETEILATDTRQQYREKIARITLESMVQFVGLLDNRGMVIEVNPIALDAAGIRLSDIEGKPLWETFWWQVSVEVNTTLHEMISRATEGEVVRWETLIHAHATGKETIVISVSICPVTDHQGNIVYLCVEGRDISQKKALEEQIAQQHTELKGLLERVQELEKIKTQFFTAISHELKTSLSLIIGPAERLMDQHSQVRTESQNDLSQAIVRNAKMLLKRVNDLLDIAKLEAGELKIELQKADVAEVLRELTSHFVILANERQVRFLVESGPSYFSAVDPEKLQRIIMNLLSNAFKFTPVGGIIRCTLEAFGKDMIFSVEDSGPGVKPELRKLIFKRFTDGDGVRNRHMARTGLGLAIVQEFVRLHHGNIEVMNSDLGGAMFRVKLPAIQLSLSKDRTPSSTFTADHSNLDGLIEELRLRVFET
jgi:PAS domain S-box-containing protein